VYCTILDSIAKVTAVIKFDLHAEPDSSKKQLEVGGNVRGIYDLGPGRFGSEAVFVPKVPGVSGEEDDGYLILFVHDENTGYVTHECCCYCCMVLVSCLRNVINSVSCGTEYRKSEVNVIDAKAMSADPVAVVELPTRVPYGFHAFFVNEVLLKCFSSYFLVIFRESATPAFCQDLNVYIYVVGICMSWFKLKYILPCAFVQEQLGLQDM
jgi:carotenoid cleavage dioxygenase